MQMYPGWSARDNYAQSKKKKRKRESETTPGRLLILVVFSVLL